MIKMVTATEDPAEVVAQQLYYEMFMKIANKDAALDCVIVACEWISDSWRREGSPHFEATAICWDTVGLVLATRKKSNI